MSEGSDLTSKDIFNDFFGEDEDTIDFSALNRDNDPPMLGPLFSDGSFTSEEHGSRVELDLLREREYRFKKSLAELHKIFTSLGDTTEDACARAAMETDIENMRIEFKKMAE